MNTKAKPMGNFERIWRFFGSFGLAVAILILLLALTYAGTIAQIDSSIHDVQKKYFDSYIVKIDLPLGIPFVVPGANLLLSLLFVNLIVGGMIRMRRDWKRAGILIIHFGIAFMLTGNLIEFLHALTDRSSFDMRNDLPAAVPSGLPLAE